MTIGVRKELNVTTCYNLNTGIFYNTRVMTRSIHATSVIWPGTKWHEERRACVFSYLCCIADLFFLFLALKLRVGL